MPSTGRITLDDVAIDRLSLRDRARHIAYMPQTLPQGVALSVLETVVAALLASPPRPPWIPKPTPRGSR